MLYIIRQLREFLGNLYGLYFSKSDANFFLFRFLARLIIREMNKVQLLFHQFIIGEVGK